MNSIACCCGFLTVALGSALALDPGPDPGRGATSPVDYMIVVTGGELLNGTYADAHTPFLTRTLQSLGCRCVGSITVDDQRSDLEHAVRFATNRAPLVIVTGGLGPTPNDITRETLSDMLAIPLREDPEALREMERRFHQSRDQIRPNLRRQTLVPSRGGYLKNPSGTAVGLVFDPGSRVVVALPGPPRELQAMVQGELIPFLERRFGVRKWGCSRTLRFVGVGQSLIDQTIQDHVQVPPGLRITSLFEEGRVDFTFSLPGNGLEDRAHLERIAEEIRRHWGRSIYAEDSRSLEEVVVDGLRSRNRALVLVEIGSRGYLAASLGRVDGDRGWLAGAYTAPTEAGMNELLRDSRAAAAQGDSAQTRMQAMATAAMEQAGSSCAIAVGPVVRAENGSGQVWVALKSGGAEWHVEPVAVRGTGELAYASLVTRILDLWRRRSP